VERKTHRESWKGEESVKERFTLPEDKMVPYLEGEYTLEQAQADLKKKVGAPSLATGRMMMVRLVEKVVV
jgi:SPX domain protein involved in polyphosphate accumulation